MIKPTAQCIYDIVLCRRLSINFRRSIIGIYNIFDLINSEWCWVISSRAAANTPTTIRSIFYIFLFSYIKGFNILNILTRLRCKKDPDTEEILI
jgi:hypothetical protein